MTDYQELKRLAEAAKRKSNEWFAPWDLPLHSIVDARYIVAANPAAVLALIAEVERLVDQVTDQGLHAASEARRALSAEAERDSAQADRAQLRTEVEALRKEAARFDFIQQDAPSIFENVYGENWLEVVDSYVFPEKGSGNGQAT